jgi:formiminotetrahydrofolate cyclodeaminase
MGTGLGSMTAKLTLGVRKLEDVDPLMRKFVPPLHQAVHDLIKLIDLDIQAYKVWLIHHLHKQIALSGEQLTSCLEMIKLLLNV